MDFVIPCKKSCLKMNGFCAIAEVFGKELNVIQVAYVKRKKSHRINNISQSLCWLELLGKSLWFFASAAPTG